MIEQDFYDQLETSQVGQEYLNLISLCKDRPLIPEQGYEIHHIFPTVLGGLNVNRNKVKFTVFEHCKAHALLAQALPCYKTLQPLTYMSKGQITKLSDLEKIELEEVYGWSRLREKALHHPKSPEHIEKNRLSHLGKKLSKEHIEKRTTKRKGTVTVTNGIDTKYIFPEELQQWEEKGWKRGISNVRREKLRESHIGLVSSSKGRICIHREEKELKIFPEQLDIYLKEGWSIGRAKSFSKKHSERMVGKTNVGKVRINRDGIGKLVSKELVSSYLEQGWNLGIVRSRHLG